MDRPSLSIAIRVDGSIEIGTGHVQRCLTLARQLTKAGHQVRFISNDTDGVADELVHASDLKIDLFPIHCTDKFEDARLTGEFVATAPVDWLVVDHYKLDEAWERMLRPYTKHILAIDDLANRRHDCDVLLDQNYYNGMGERYRNLVAPDTQLLLGPKNALLREEFHRARSNLTKRDGSVSRILVSFGGGDSTGETLKVMRAVKKLKGVKFDVVISARNPDYVSIVKLCDAEPKQFTLHIQIDYIARLMADADLSIGAGGSSSWERCYMGLPSITVVTADNQIATTKDLSYLGAIHFLGRSDEVSAEDYYLAVQNLRSDSDWMQRMSNCGLELLAEKPDKIVQLLEQISVSVENIA